jgi:hypothetical protein
LVPSFFDATNHYLILSSPQRRYTARLSNLLQLSRARHTEFVMCDQTISVINPAQAHYFAKAQLRQAKNDAASCGNPG